MKFLKFLLVLLLIVLLIILGGVIFSNRIVSDMTKTKNSQFKNLRYSITESEITFDDFFLNGRSLGKGKAKVNFTRTGFMGLKPEIRISTLKLEEVNMELLYDTADKQVDSFLEKLDKPVNKETIRKTAEEFVGEAKKELDKVNTDIDTFLKDKLKDSIVAVNKIKTDYGSSPDLKSKAQKASELDKAVKPIIDSISNQKEAADKAISKIELERNVMFSDISEQLAKLERFISLNNVQNMNSYIFLDKGKNIISALDKTLKTVNLIKEIKNLPLGISDVDINNGAIKFSGLNGTSGEPAGEILLDSNLQAEVKMKDGDYEISYKENNLTIRTLSGKRITSVIEYSKEGILDGKTVKLISELIYDNNNLENLNRTVLTEEEKAKLAEKISNLQQTQYQEIMTKYEGQVKIMEDLITSVYEKRSKLEKLQRELLSLNTMAVLEDGTGVSSDTSPEKNEAVKQGEKNEAR